MEEALKDERFNHILTDPRFRKMPKHVSKIAVDKRFKEMFKDKKFTEKCKLDKRGRSLNLTSSENLEKLYDISSKPKQVSTSAQIKEKKAEESSDDTKSEEESSEKSDDDVETGSEENGEVQSTSEESDDSDSESDESSESQTEFDHQWEEFRNEAPDTDEITRRIAVCNMDWDRIRAEDIFACFNSFKPSDGRIISVKIYPSEYGLQRMEEEKIKGPLELVEETLPLEEEEVTEDKKGSKYHREKLRQYQINRLKYYYAVVECDEPETANTVYEQLNGMEYESSSVRFDLRFIPDDVTFDHEPISVADKVPDPTEYKPRLFVTTALQQVKVNLTWDETDPKRRETLQKAFTQLDSIERDIQEYLASSSGDGESDDEEIDSTEEAESKIRVQEKITKYKKLLQSLEEKEKEEKEKYEMEITWEPGLKEKTEEIVKEKMKKSSLNPFEEMLQKKKEDRKLKKKELKAKQKKERDVSSSASDDDDDLLIKKKDEDAKRLAELALISDSKKNININETDNKRKKKKNKEQKIDNFKCDVNDPRFSAIYSSHLYNIDPSDPHFKKTEGNLALIQEKQRKLKSAEFLDKKSKSKRAKYS